MSDLEHQMITIRIKAVEPDKTGSNYCSPIVIFEIVNNSNEDILFDHFITKYFLEIHAKNGEILTLDESKRLEMLYSRTTRIIPEPERLNHNTSREFRIDLAEFYYPFSEGEYSFYACCKIKDRDLIRSDLVPYTVFQTKVIEDFLWYENPVFGNLSLLSKSVGNGNTQDFYMRWFNPDHPLASNFTKKISAIPADSEVVVAHPSFFTLEDFDPSFEKCLICFNRKDALQVIDLFLGEIQSVSPSLCFENEVRILPFAFRNEKRTIYLFTLEDDRRITCYTIDSANQIAPSFTYTFKYSLKKYGIKNTLSISGGPDLIHIVSFGHGLNHTILDYNGNLIASTKLSAIQDIPVFLNTNLYQNTIKVVYYSGKNNYTFFQSTYSDIHGTFTKLEKPFRLIFSPEEMLEEIDFMYSESQSLQLLYSTSTGRLIYGDEYIGFKRLLKNREIRYPRVVAGDIEMFRPFIGFALPQTGYRFYSIEGHDTWKEILRTAI
jgi:hypothetical protein